MWYFEQRHMGTWQPRTSWGKPRANPHQNDRPANRQIVKVSADHETLPLDEIAAIYGTKEVVA
jgi:hypothetical protein